MLRWCIIVSGDRHYLGDSAGNSVIPFVITSLAELFWCRRLSSSPPPHHYLSTDRGPLNGTKRLATSSCSDREGGTDNRFHLAPVGTRADDCFHLAPLGRGADDRFNLAPVGSGAEDRFHLAPVGSVAVDRFHLAPVGRGADNRFHCLRLLQVPPNTYPPPTPVSTTFLPLPLYCRCCRLTTILVPTSSPPPSSSISSSSPFSVIIDVHNLQFKRRTRREPAELYSATYERC